MPIPLLYRGSTIALRMAPCRGMHHTADAIKAYVQALLKSKHQTWIELPPELRPKWWREKFARPVVLLLRALYGHPDAGGLWEQHLAHIIRGLGGKEVPEFPGNYWFPQRRLCCRHTWTT